MELATSQPKHFSSPFPKTPQKGQKKENVPNNFKMPSPHLDSQIQ